MSTNPKNTTKWETCSLKPSLDTLKMPPLQIWEPVLHIQIGTLCCTKKRFWRTPRGPHSVDDFLGDSVINLTLPVMVSKSSPSVSNGCCFFSWIVIYINCGFVMLYKSGTPSEQYYYDVGCSVGYLHQVNKCMLLSLSSWDTNLPPILNGLLSSPLPGNCTI